MGVTESKRAVIESWETKAVPLPRGGRGRGVQSAAVNRRDLQGRRLLTMMTATESRSHKASGAFGEVRVTHSSQSTGKPCTRRRGRQDQKESGVRT